MEPAMILTIITAALSFAISVTSIVLGVIKSRNENINSVITKGRVNTMTGIRDAFAGILSLAELPVIIRYRSDRPCEYPVKLSAFRAELHKYIKPIYSIDARLLELADGLCEKAIGMYESSEQVTEEEKTEFLAARKTFECAFSTYDWAYWQYIQEQARGRKMNSGTDFNEFYKNFIESIKTDADAVINTGDLQSADLKIK